MSWVVVIASAAPFWGCGTEFSITLSRGEGAAVEGKAVVNGAKRTFQGQADADGNISWDIEGCRGSAKVAPNSQVLVSCSDPLLAEWPDCWILTGATWSAPELGLSGTVLVEPAGAFYLDPDYGSIVTDPGYSAWVLNLDVDNIGPTMIEIDMHFDTSACPDLVDACLKGLDVALVQPISPPGQPRQIVPSEGLGVDFTVFGEGDPHVVCLDDPTSVKQETWGKLKTLYR
jgi:hypothetical protein